MPAHKHKNRGRKPLPEALPGVGAVYELILEERCCLHDGYTPAEINEVVLEQLGWR